MKSRSPGDLARFIAPRFTAPKSFNVSNYVCFVGKEVGEEDFYFWTGRFERSKEGRMIGEYLVDVT